MTLVPSVKVDSIRWDSAQSQTASLIYWYRAFVPG
jgi:hypothetical protein